MHVCRRGYGAARRGATPAPGSHGNKALDFLWIAKKSYRGRRPTRPLLAEGKLGTSMSISFFDQPRRYQFELRYLRRSKTRRQRFSEWLLRCPKAEIAFMFCVFGVAWLLLTATMIPADERTRKPGPWLVTSQSVQQAMPQSPWPPAPGIEPFLRVLNSPEATSKGPSRLGGWVTVAE